MYRDVTHMETVEIPDEFFDMTFIRQLKVQSFSSFLFQTSNKSSQVFFRSIYHKRPKSVPFQKKQKKERYEKASPRSWRPSVAGCQKKKQKTVPIPEEKEEKKKQKVKSYVEAGKKDNCTTRWWLKAVFLNISRIPTGKRCETLSKNVLRHTPRVLSRRRQD
jgi:hypothetical protein